MEITEVRIKLMEEAGERLQAFCSITLDDCFVVRDLKIIDGLSGPFVAMPSRKLTLHCPSCRYKNHLRAPFCNQCGKRITDDRAAKDDDTRMKLFADIAHPINAACREMIQNRVIAEFEEEVARSKLPGYVCSYDDFYHDEPTTRQVHQRHTGPRPAGDVTPKYVPSSAASKSHQGGPHIAPTAPATAPHAPAPSAAPLSSPPAMNMQSTAGAPAPTIHSAHIASKAPHQSQAATKPMGNKPGNSFGAGIF